MVSPEVQIPAMVKVVTAFVIVAVAGVVTTGAAGTALSRIQVTLLVADTLPAASACVRLNTYEASTDFVTLNENALPTHNCDWVSAPLKLTKAPGSQFPDITNALPAVVDGDAEGLVMATAAGTTVSLVQLTAAKAE